MDTWTAAEIVLFKRAIYRIILRLSLRLSSI